MIIASPQTKTYGQALNLGTTAFTTSGLVNGDMVTSVVLASPGASATATVAGSPYVITPGAQPSERVWAITTFPINPEH